MTRIAHVVLWLGVLVVAAAVAWWWLTFRDVISYDYISTREAAVCLLGRSDTCDLARSLCRGAHPLALLSYWWGSFWIGLLVVSASLAVGGPQGSRLTGLSPSHSKEKVG
ncbi:MAG: hypothetical protein P4M07_18275 [Xanthobacteraceae bacterium]|nr:hypothetical protein [Xanthobacteraceae bacterium]